MPRWLMSVLILVGFLTLAVMALLPKNVAVNVTINADERGADAAKVAPDATPPSP